MSTRNWSHQRKGNIKYTAKTALSTLTKSELDHGVVTLNHGTAFATTLPAASSLYKGCLCYIGNKGTGSSTVVCTEGFGGAASGANTATLTQGDGTIVWCNGSEWFTTFAAVT